MTNLSPDYQAYLDAQHQAWDGPANDIRKAAEDYYTSVRANRDLTPEAKQARIVRRHAEAKQAMDAQHQTDAGESAAALAAAKRAAFGIDDLTRGMSPAETAATQMAFRDAQQRAQQALGSPQQMQALLDQAEDTGDEMLARAVGNAVIGQYGGNDSVSQAYLSRRPAKQAAIEQLSNQSQLDPTALFQHALPTPPEVQSLTPGQLDQILGAG